MAAQRQEKLEAKRVEQEEAKIEAYQLVTQMEQVEMMELQTRNEEKLKKEYLKQVWDQQKDKTQRSNWDLEDPRNLHNTSLPRNPLPVYTTHELPHASNCQILEAEYREDPRILRNQKMENRNALTANMLDKYNRKLAEAQTDATTAWAMQTMSESIQNLQILTEMERRNQAKLIAQDNAELLAIKQRQEEESKLMEQTRNQQALNALNNNPMLLQDARTGYMTGTTVTGSNRKLSDSYRGMLNSERLMIQQELKDTILKRAYDKDEQRRRKIEEDKALLTLESTVLSMAQIEEAERKMKQQQYYDELKHQADTKILQKKLQKEKERVPVYPTNAGILAGFGNTVR